MQLDIIQGRYIKMDAKQIIAKIEEKKPYLKKVHHIEEIGLFGSVARGEQTATSDIDILVKFEKGHSNLFNYIQLKDYLEKLLENKVDLVMKNSIRPRLKDRILNETKYV